MEHAHHGFFVEPHDYAFRHCCDCRQAPWLTRQTALAKEILLPMDCDDCFLPQVRKDGDLDLAVLNVKDSIRQISLREDGLILLISRYGPAPVHGGEKRFDVEGLLPL